MHLHCPHCRNPIEVVDESTLEEINCPSCGSSFHFARDSTTDWKPTSQKLGKFELLESIGQGGFGTIYKARDHELERTVAVKVLRAHRLSEDNERDRFLREARSVAQLRHSSIVALHEVGEDNGVPYLVSDFVEGLTLTDVLSAGVPALNQAAQWTAVVAEALQYAHEQGVIHRDIKPSNIIIRPDDSPCVLDFGLAKREAGEITVTVEGQILGTPAYMPPEQAKGEAHQVDGRSDVYSLGVVLYQMLTGELPFRGTTRMLLHQVLHDEPRPPRKLNDRIPRDVETICLKAMAKERQRRYQTARELAEDLRRFLRGEAIQARPVGKVEKAWRWCRRNRMTAGLTAAVAVSLIVGTVLASYFAIRANQEAGQAAEKTKETIKALIEARKQRDAATAQKERADANLLLAKKAVDEYLQGVSKDNVLLLNPHMRRLRKKLVEAALPFYETFVKQNPGDARFELERGLAYMKLAVMHSMFEEHQSALGYLQKALNVFQQLAKDQPANLTYAHHSAQVHMNFAVACDGLGKSNEALTHARQAVKTLQRVVATDPDDRESAFAFVRSCNNLSQLLQDHGKKAEAEKMARQTVSLAEKLLAAHTDIVTFRQELANAQGRLANILMDGHKLAEAEKAYRQAIRTRTTLHRIAPYQRELAYTLNNFSVLLEKLGKNAEAETHSRRAIAIQRVLVEKYSSIPQYRRELAASYINFARVLGNRGAQREALEALDNGKILAEKLVREFPSVLEYSRDLAIICQNRGVFLLTAGKHADAEASHRQALALWKQLAAKYPSVSEHHQGMAQAHFNIGEDLRVMKKYAEAEKSYRQTLKELAARSTGPTWFLGQVHRRLANVLEAQQRLEEAEKHFRQSVAVFAPIAARFPSVATYSQEFGQVCNSFGLLLRRLGKTQEARAVYERGIASLKQVSPKSGPRDVPADLGGIYCNMGALVRADDPGESLPWYQKAITTLQTAPPHVSRARTFLRNAHWGRANALTSLSRHKQAADDWLRCAELDQGKYRQMFRRTAALSLARAGEHARAFQLARQLSKSPSSGIQLYKLAQVCACCSAATNDDGEKNRYSQQAVALLKKALARGYRLPFWLFDHPDLTILRGRSDFKEVMGKNAPIADAECLKVFRGKLTTNAPPDTFALTRKSRRRIHNLQLEAGKSYCIDLSAEFDALLRIETKVGEPLAYSDDIRLGELPDARIIFTPAQAGEFRLIVTSYGSGGTGLYALRIRRAQGRGAARVLHGKLTKNSPERNGIHSKVHAVQLKANVFHTVELESDFDPSLGVAQIAAKPRLLAKALNGRTTKPNRARIDFLPTTDGTYAIIVATKGPGEFGVYSLRIQSWEVINEKVKE